MNKLLKFLMALLFTALNIGAVILVWYLIARLFNIDFQRYLLIAVIGVWVSNLFDKYYRRV